MKNSNWHVLAAVLFLVFVWDISINRGRLFSELAGMVQPVAADIGIRHHRHWAPSLDFSG